MKKENKMVVFNYEGMPVTFNNGDDVMVNATEMAKGFGKKVAHWLENDSTSDFLQVLGNQKGRNFDTSDTQLVKIVMGSPANGGGTWMHEDVAMEFARWLDPMFAIWCNAKIKELLIKGFTGVNNETTGFIEDTMGEDIDALNGILDYMKDGRKIGKPLMRYFEYVDGNIDEMLLFMKKLYGRSDTYGEKEKTLLTLESNAKVMKKRVCDDLYLSDGYTAAGDYERKFKSDVLLWISDSRERLLKRRVTMVNKQLDKLRGSITDRINSLNDMSDGELRAYAISRAAIKSKQLDADLHPNQILGMAYSILNEDHVIDWRSSKTKIDAVKEAGLLIVLIDIVDSLV